MKERTRPLAVRPFGRLLASYTVNEFGDSVGIVALAVLVYDRTGEVAPTAALFLAGKFLPALDRAVPHGAARSARRAPHAAVALRRRGARLRRAGAGSRDGASLLAVVLALALVDGAIAVTARALTRGAIASILQPAHLLREGNALLNIGFAVAVVGGSALAGLLISEFGLSAALARRCRLVPGHRDRARAHARPAQAPGRAAGHARAPPQRPRVRPPGPARPAAAGRPVASRSSSSR